MLKDCKNLHYSKTSTLKITTPLTI